MRRKIKRRLFLMGMAVAAGAIGHAHAKGGKLGQGEHDYSAWSANQLSTLPFDPAPAASTLSDGLLGRFKAMLGGLDYTVQGGVGAPRRQGWGLQLFRPEAVTGVSDDPRLNGGQMGVALRINF